MIDAVLKDVVRTYPFVGGGGISAASARPLGTRKVPNATPEPRALLANSGLYAYAPVRTSMA